MTIISIITTTRDNFDSLKITAENLKFQEAGTFEWLVYDGSRTEERERIEAYVTQMGQDMDCPVTYKHSVDSGFYDAAGKSVKYANSDYVLFLNAGDVLTENNTASKMAAELEAHTPDILHGQSIYVNADGEVNLHRGRPADEVLKGIDAEDDYIYFQDLVCQQAVVYRKSIFDRFGFDDAYWIAGDHEHFLRCARAGLSMHYWPHAICIYFAGGFSFVYAQNCKMEWLRVQLQQVAEGAEVSGLLPSKVFQTLNAYLPILRGGMS
ncbi:glycosyltransferase [Ruegeria halocynthiae]|uniref:glycosyltransferase n=1 Tax=Ruegeria halocynthiae TaxID=985054 RepID=UPI0005691785|nr:glycosyltransferase [Ruegeria halocynthiae]